MATATNKAAAPSTAEALVSMTKESVSDMDVATTSMDSSQLKWVADNNYTVKALQG
jgi:hypothetical protein